LARWRTEIQQGCQSIGSFVKLFTVALQRDKQVSHAGSGEATPARQSCLVEAARVYDA
jgi:hypothetical protein